jgi:carbonic anhydrase/acetyltransferase-like protein (isoleucine patch superfamily)
MGAVVLDNAHIGSYTIVGAGAVVRNNTRVPDGVLVAGVPAKIIRDLTKDERDSIDESAQNYVDYVKLYRQQTA